MDLLDLLMGGGVPQVFKLGFFPKENDFLELTAEQYQSYYRQMGDTNEKVYVLLPEDLQNQGFDDFDGLCVCTEHDKEVLLSGVEMIEKLCKESGQEFKNDKQKMRYAANSWPPVFSKVTEFEVPTDSQGNPIHSTMKIVK